MTPSYWSRLLRNGVQEWNEWRASNPESRPHFHEGDFGPDRRFRGINLSRSYLAFLNLDEIDLSEADLTEAELTGASLQRASFRGASLKNARLVGANLTGADLRIADLHGAMFGGTILSSTNLAKVINVEHVIHLANSTFDLSTISMSGALARSFLEGCGVAAAVIEYADSLLAHRAIETKTAFLSYAHEDEEFATRLHIELKRQNIRTWFAPEDMRIGDKVRQTIDEAIRFHDRVIVILSAHSLSSDWVASEVEAAFEEERRRRGTILFPLMIDNAIAFANEAWAAEIRRTRHIGDFTKWRLSTEFTSAFKRLIRDFESARLNA